MTQPISNVSNKTIKCDLPLSDTKNGVMDFVAQRFSAYEVALKRLQDRVDSLTVDNRRKARRVEELEKMNLKLIAHNRRQANPCLCQIIKSTLNRLFYPNWSKQQHEARLLRQVEREENLRGMKGKTVIPKVVQSESEGDSSLEEVPI